jgi:hypothetical protein
MVPVMQVPVMAEPPMLTTQVATLKGVATAMETMPSLKGAAAAMKATGARDAATAAMKTATAAVTSTGAGDFGGEHCQAEHRGRSDGQDRGLPKHDTLHCLIPLGSVNRLSAYWSQGRGQRFTPARCDRRGGVFGAVSFLQRRDKQGPRPAEITPPGPGGP